MRSSTVGRPRTLHLGNAQVQIEHAPQWQLALGATAAGDAVRALAWLGQSFARAAVAKLHKSTRSFLPPWMAEAIEREAACR